MRAAMSDSKCSRRDFLAGTGLFGAALFAPSLACGEEPAPRRGDPRFPRNVILITGDDLGWKDLSSSGNPNLKTPNLDRLKRGGVSFEYAFDVTSTCSSSRATYATGQYPHTHGVVGLVHRLPELSLSEGTPTLASRLRDAGFRTAIEGKWHLAHPQSPEPYGYDDVMTSIATQWIVSTEKTVDFIARTADRRFFFEINYMNPHRNPLGVFVSHPDHPVDPATLIIPEYVSLPDVPGVRAELASYYSQVERMDAMIGVLVATLEEHGLLDDTLIAFISDNGIPFPGNKLNLYDRGTGTPFFFHWPAGLPAEIVRNELVSSVDLMPTLLDAVGVPIPAEVQGRSLLPLLRDPAAKGGETAIFSEMTRHKDTPFPMRSVRTARYRYIRNYSDEPVPLEGGDQPWVAEVLASAPDRYRWGKRRPPEELYDLASDPQEQNDLVASGAAEETLRELRALLDEHMARTADPLLGAPFVTT